MLFIFIIFFAISIFAFKFKTKDQKNILAVECFLLAIIAGWRENFWPDTFVYVISFRNFTNGIVDFSPLDKPYGYGEMGFYYLGVIVKTFTDNEQVYLACIAGLSMFFLYKGISKYSIYPLIGICAYLVRFYAVRDLSQIRSGLAYSIIISGLYLVHEKKLLRFVLFIWIVSWIHKSAWIALPFYFFCNTVKITNTRIKIWLVIAFVLGTFFQGPISSFVTDNADDLSVTTYTQGQYVEEALGMANPMIYFQCLLLLLYTSMEDKLAPVTTYYYTIRAGYLYSTLILITFCSFTALSGRTSTMFATLEFCIIPSLLNVFPKSQRMGLSFLVGLFLLAVLLLKIRGEALFVI